MRKATGKVVSLVLALALVITSFSATFASAATKTESGDASLDSSISDTIYLANTSNQQNSVEDKFKQFNLTEYLDDKVTLETYDHIVVPATDVSISQVTVSGDNIIRVSKTGSDESAVYTINVRDAKGSGTATLNILFTGNDNRGDDEITVRGSLKLTVKLLDASTPILVPSIPAAGAAPGSFGSLQKNPNEPSVTGVAGEDGSVAASTTTGYVVIPSVNTSSGNDATAIYTVQELAVKDDADKTGYDTADYVVAATGTRNYIKLGEGNKITFGVGVPSVGNSVRLTAYSIKDDNSDVNKTVGQVTVKVENKIVLTGAATVDVGDSSTGKNINGKANSTLSKSKTYVTNDSGSTYWEATGATIEISSGNLKVVDGRVGNIKTTTSGNIEINDGSVGDVEAAGTILVAGGTATSVKSSNNVNIEGATVGEVKNANTLTVSAGKVSGAVSATTVLLSPASDEETVSVGAVSAEDLTVDGSVGVASAASFEATAEGDLVLQGEKASVGAIDVDYRNTTITLNAFVGSIPAPTNAHFTGFDETGATLNTDNSGDTKATVSGALSIENLSIESGAVTFTDAVKVANLTGGDADLIVSPSKLYISDMISTSNTLKLANAADVKGGTVVFYAASEIADVDSFVRFGYELDVRTSGGNDYFVISGVDFAGLTLSETSLELVKGESAVVTAYAYPNGTQLPEGTKVEFYLNGDLNYMEGANIGNNQAEVKAIDYNADFDVLNKGTLTAVVLDEYDIQLEEYGEAVCDITIVETKAPTETYKSDTTGDVVVPSGNTYQFKITSLNGQTPSVVLGSDGVFELVGTSQNGNDYFFKYQAVGASGAATGVYVNGDAKVATMYVDGNTGYTCDTTTVNVPAGGTYQVKITAASMPTLLPGNSIYTVAFASQEGNDYFFKITATSAQAGDVVGFYINGGPRAFVATTV